MAKLAGTELPRSSCISKAARVRAPGKSVRHTSGAGFLPQRNFGPKPTFRGDRRPSSACKMSRVALSPGHRASKMEGGPDRTISVRRIGCGREPKSRFDFFGSWPARKFLRIVWHAVVIAPARLSQRRGLFHRVVQQPVRSSAMPAAIFLSPHPSSRHFAAARRPSFPTQNSRYVSEGKLSASRTMQEMPRYSSTVHGGGSGAIGHHASVNSQQKRRKQG